MDRASTFSSQLFQNLRQSFFQLLPGVLRYWFRVEGVVLNWNIQSCSMIWRRSFLSIGEIPSTWSLPSLVRGKRQGVRTVGRIWARRTVPRYEITTHWRSGTRSALGSCHRKHLHPGQRFTSIPRRLKWSTARENTTSDIRVRVLKWCLIVHLLMIMFNFAAADNWDWLSVLRIQRDRGIVQWKKRERGSIG